MRRAISFAALLLAAGLGGCTTAEQAPVEVSRFSRPELASVPKGPVTILPAPGNDGGSIEFRGFASAVGQELDRLGYPQGAGPSAGEGAGGNLVVTLDVQRQVYRGAPRQGPVSVGIGGSSGGGWHSGGGVGMGIGFNLGGGPKDQVETRLAVSIRDRATGDALWEGRARYVVAAKSPDAAEPAVAAKMAHALFEGFPGKSGETILVK